MNQRELELIWKKRVKVRIKELLITKGREYANEGDRLENFKHGAALVRKTKDQYLFGLVSKQIVSWADYTERVSEGEDISYEKWEEKLIDIMVYATLHLSMRLEEELDGPINTASVGSKEFL